jgi:hypothetical protein
MPNPNPNPNPKPKKVCLNALKHGFSGHTVLVPEHEAEAFRQHSEKFRQEYRPKGITEEVLVQSLADLSWSTQQIRAQLTNLMAITGSMPNNIPNAPDPRMDFALSQAQQLERHISTINLLGVYEQRKMRLFHATRRELVLVQAERKQREAAELEAAASIREATRSAPSPWTPLEDGFECSVEEIDRFIARRERLKTNTATLHQAC